MPVTQQIGECLATGVSLPTRSILITEEIDDATVRQVWTAIQALDREGTNFNVFIHSIGGYISSGLAIYDMLKACRANVITIGIGRVYSMAVDILQAGDERYLSPNTTLFIHPANTAIDESRLSDARIELEDAVRSEDQSIKLMAERMGITPVKFKKLFPNPTYLTAEEAVKLKLADGLLE